MPNENDEENPKAGSAQINPKASGEIQANWYNVFLQHASVYGVAAGYCLSASLLSIINKWAIMKFPYPGALTALQYFTSAFGVFICGWLKFIEHDRLELLTMWRFLPAAVIFYLSFSPIIKHEISDETDWYSFGVILPVGLSCLFGLSISFFGFSCRRAISATGFTVLGIVNKLLTVVINFVIWDKHSTFVGTLGLLICMLGGVMYQQSTSNKPKAAVQEVKAQGTLESEEEQQKLLEMQSNSERTQIEKEATHS
uniref:GDP-mannose transporter GONST3 n=1 Tax=Cannabis sativa TaxID=3483 RepID=A0A803NU14_CANSA